MLHEILLSLSGHPSPLLTADHSSSSSILSPPEKALLSSIAHLSNLHCKLLAHTATIATSHPSSICQAVATAIKSTHLAKFQLKVLEVEDGILRKDAGTVGAYNIVPLTAIVGEFSGWTRRMEWFLEVVEFMMRGNCSGAMVIDRLCAAMQTGYVDVEEAALSLVRVSETAWLKQVSAWVLYGRLPSFGREDFFVQMVHGDVQVRAFAHDKVKRKLTWHRSITARRSYCLRLSRRRQQALYSLLADPSTIFESRGYLVQIPQSWTYCRPICSNFQH